MIKLLIALLVLGSLLLTPQHAEAATCPSDSGWKKLTISAHSYKDVTLDTACSGDGYFVGSFKNQRPARAMRVGMFDPNGTGGDWGSSPSGISQVTRSSSVIPGVWTMRVYNDTNRSYRVTARLTIEVP